MFLGSKFPMYSHGVVTEVEPYSQTHTDNAIDGTVQSSFDFTNLDIGSADASRYVVVCVNWMVATADTADIDTITVGGITPSLVVHAAGSGSNRVESSMYIAAVPTGTAATVAITFTDNADGCAVSIYRLVGIASTTPYDTNTASLTSTATANTPIAVPAGGGVIGARAYRTSSAVRTTVWTGITEDVDEGVSLGSANLSHTTANDTFTTTNLSLSVSSTGSGGTQSSSCAVIASWAKDV